MFIKLWKHQQKQPSEEQIELLKEKAQKAKQEQKQLGTAARETLQIAQEKLKTMEIMKGYHIALALERVLIMKGKYEADLMARRESEQQILKSEYDKIIAKGKFSELKEHINFEAKVVTLYVTETVSFLARAYRKSNAKKPEFIFSDHNPFIEDTGDSDIGIYGPPLIKLLTTLLSDMENLWCCTSPSSSSSFV